MKRYRPHPRRLAYGAIAACAAALVPAAPAFAQSEIEALKQQLDEQRKLIDQLISERAEEKKAKVITPPPIDQNPAVPVGGGSSLGFFGTLDLNVGTATSGYGHKTIVGSGGMTASRIGVKGEKTIMEGVRAVGVAEAGLLLNTGSVGNTAPTLGINLTSASSGGANGSGPQLLSRQIYGGVATDRYGALTLGRQYAGSYSIAATANSLGVGFYGASGPLLSLSGLPTRMNNSLVYFTPKLFGGLVGQFNYTTGSQNNVRGEVPSAAGATTKTNDRAGRGTDVALVWSNGPLYLSAGHWDVYNTTYAATETGLARRRGSEIGAIYDLGMAKLYATAVTGRIAGGNYENVTRLFAKTSGWSVSGSAPFGKSTVYVSYSKFSDKATSRDARMMGISYSYLVMPKTYVYVSWGKLLNNANGNFVLNDGGDLVGTVATPGLAPNAVMTGFNYSF